MTNKSKSLTWNSPDSSGNEQGWSQALWVGVLKAISNFEGKGYGENPELHKYLMKAYPETAWETKGRSYFSDFSKAWTITKVARISAEEMTLTPTGKKIISGEISIFEGLKDFVLNYKSDENYAFRKIIETIQIYDRPFTTQEIYNELNAQDSGQASHPRQFGTFFLILELMGVICERKSKWSIYNYQSFRILLETIHINMGKNENKENLTFIAVPKILETYNCIYYGPPGTGKTKAAQYFSHKLLSGTALDSEIPQMELLGQESVQLDHDNFFSTQFHPSFSYEDFMEGLRPIQVRTFDKSDVSYLVTPGIFKVASELARAVSSEGEYGIEVDAQFIKNTNGESFWDIGENSLISSYKFKNRNGFFKFNEIRVLNTGKSGTELLVPNGSEPDRTGIYKLTWYSDKDQNSNFVILIDELNRGNASAIFGEALSLIETSKRIGLKEQTFLTLPYSKKQFGVPRNLHIICAMNSSDKSLISMDQAFRRRFKFHYVAPDFSIILSPKFSEIIKEKKLRMISPEYLLEIKNYFDILNKSLKEAGYSEDNHIGHSYLIALISRACIQLTAQTDKDEKTVINIRLKELWRRELHPLLRDIIGEFKISEFCDHFCSNLTKLGETKLFGQLDNNIHKNVSTFLNDPTAKEELYPWAKAN